MIENPIERAKRWIEEKQEVILLEEKNNKLEEIIVINQPKIDFHDTYQTAEEGDLEMEEAARAVGLGLKTYYKFLRWGKIFLIDEKKNLPQEKYRKGCFKVIPYTYTVHPKEGDPFEKNGVKVYITPDGLARMGRFYKKHFERFKLETTKPKF